MLNFENLESTELSELQQIISNNVEKSELEKYYLYTNDTLEKAKIFIWCHRFLYSVANLTKEGSLKKVLLEEVNLCSGSYTDINHLLHKTEKGHFNRHRNLEKLRVLLLTHKEIDDLIDSFCVLLQKTSMLSMSRLKGFVLEGQSEKEFKKIFFNKPLTKPAESETESEEESFPEENEIKSEENLPENIKE